MWTIVTYSIFLYNEYMGVYWLPSIPDLWIIINDDKETKI